jgi:hypothetical protein
LSRCLQLQRHGDSLARKGLNYVQTGEAICDDHHGYQRARTVTIRYANPASIVAMGSGDFPCCHAACRAGERSGNL